MEQIKIVAKCLLTWPFRSISLFVSFAFSKEITCLVSASNVNGVSGCACRRGGGGGSAFPIKQTIKAKFD